MAEGLHRLAHAPQAAGRRRRGGAASGVLPATKAGPFKVGTASTPSSQPWLLARRRVSPACQLRSAMAAGRHGWDVAVRVKAIRGPWAVHRGRDSIASSTGGAVAERLPCASTTVMTLCIVRAIENDGWRALALSRSVGPHRPQARPAA